MTEYKIRDLRDIFNLPTYDLMERCLNELKTGMLVARAQADMMAEVSRTLAAQHEVELPSGNYVQWPEECIWRDDDDGTFEHQIAFRFPDGETIKTVISGSKQEP